MCNDSDVFLMFFLSIMGFNKIIFTYSDCNLPAKLVGQWTDVTKSTTVTFTSTKLVNWRAKLTGVAYYNHTCISNTENVYIFR